MNRCFLCKLEGDFINHILLHCTKARILWHLLFSLFEVVWMIPFSMKDNMISWHGSFVGNEMKKV